VPKLRDPDTAPKLLAAAARLLAEEGRHAVTARRLASDVGTSTMAVYTHFGSMDELVLELLRDGFRRFGEALDGPAVTDDPVADWLTQGWAYRRFALDNRHLYLVMFSDGLAALAGHPAESAAAGATFVSLHDRIQRCVDTGRIAVADLVLAGEAVWASSHGHMSIELTGYFESCGRDPEGAYAECMRRLALGFGANPDALDDSMTVARRRARALWSANERNASPIR
jgi:AcrR family transcriptional regulator